MISKILPIFLKEKSADLRFLELKNFIKNAPQNSVILAPELAFSHYDKNFDDDKAQCEIQDILEDRILIYTRYYDFCGTMLNAIFAINKFGAFHIRGKSKHFLPNKENEFFEIQKETQNIKFNINGVICGSLICFELRFVELWHKLKGCDIIFVPAMWGESRKEHFFSLCKALAIINNCFVVFCSGGDEKILKNCGVFLPDGNKKEFCDFDPNLIDKIKKGLGL